MLLLLKQWRDVSRSLSFKGSMLLFVSISSFHFAACLKLIIYVKVNFEGHGNWILCTGIKKSITRRTLWLSKTGFWCVNYIYIYIYMYIYIYTYIIYYIYILYIYIIYIYYIHIIAVSIFLYFCFWPCWFSSNVLSSIIRSNQHHHYSVDTCDYVASFNHDGKNGCRFCL